MIATLKDLIVGAHGGLTHSELSEMMRRNKFSNFLPWQDYDEKTNMYTTNEDPQQVDKCSRGFIWECIPVNFGGEKTFNNLHGLLRAGLPDRSIIQFHLYGDKYCDRYFEVYKKLKVRQSPLVEDVTNAYCDFLKKGTQGFKNAAGIPLRIFRLFITIKMPAPDDKIPESLFNPTEIYNNSMESLRSAGLWPEPMKPDQLVDWALRFFNDKDIPENLGWDDTRPIAKQVILSDTVIRDKKDHLIIGDRYFRCITPKKFPPKMDPMKANSLFGGIWGTRTDGDQIKTPFLFTWNIFIEKKLQGRTERLCNLVLGQQGWGSLATSLLRKQEEYKWATDQMRLGKQFVRVLPIMWTWGTEQESRESISRIRRMWQGEGFTMQQDRGILKALFLAALPLGLIEKNKNIDNLERDFPVDEDTAIVCAPVQADFAGGGAPYLITVGRKGQLATLDLFSPKATNYNAFVTGGSGSGKSVLINSINFNYFAGGAKISIVDIGGSYKKQAHLMPNARYLDFTGESDICINPFSNVTMEQDEESAQDVDEDLATITNIVHQMTISSTDKMPAGDEETSVSLIDAAVRWAYYEQREHAHEGFVADIDKVYDYLMTYPRHAQEHNKNFSPLAAEKFQLIAQTLALNLTKFTSEGRHGKWFNGPSNFDISKDDFVVLELESLRGKGDLFKVVILQILNAVTFDLYLTDKSRPRFVIFDEAWQYLKGDDSAGGSGILIKKVIESGYRRARKYNGSFIIATQSPLDMRQFGDIGDVIKSNSAFHCYLMSNDYEKAKHEKLLDVDEFTLAYLKSVQTVPYQYSEIYMETPFGKGVSRLMLDPLCYYTYTTSPKDVSEIEKIVTQGKTYSEAIHEMAAKNGHKWERGK